MNLYQKLLPKLLISTACVMVISSALSFLSVQSASAISATSYDPGNIIDDAVFTNSNSMTVSQIQAFLNSKVPTCDTMGTKTSELGGGTRAQWLKAHGINVPITCLKDFYENPSTGQNNYGKSAKPAGAISAAQIIYNYARQFTINPQTLIVTLQKENGLVTDEWPTPKQFTQAMGFGCPDNVPAGAPACDPAYNSFSTQIYQAARHFRGFMDNDYCNSNWCTPKTTGNNTILWNPNSACGSSVVNIRNRATVALYSYTPYRPNQAALNAGYGTGDSCSSYGNRNFYLYFNDWFGSTKFAQPTGAILYRQSSNGRIYLVANDKRFYIPSPGIMDNYGLSSFGTIPASDSDIQSFSDGGNLTNVIRDNAGKIYLVNDGVRNYISSASICTNWNIGCFDTSVAKNLGDSFTLTYLKNGQNLNNTAHFNNVYYQMLDGKRLPYANTTSFTASGFTTSAAVNVNASNISQPLGKLQITTPGVIKFSPKPELYYYNGNGYYKIASMAVYDAWKLGNVQSISAPTSSFNAGDDVPVADTLSYWYKSAGGETFVINDGTKLALTAPQQQLWPTATYTQGLDSIANNLSEAKLGNFIKVGVDFYQLLPEVGEKRYIAGMADYTGLGGNNSNTTKIDSDLASSIKSGPFAFADGRLIKVEGDATIYVMVNGNLWHVSSMPVLNAYRFETSKMKIYPAAGVNQYNKLGDLTNSILPNGTVYIPYNNKLISISADLVNKSGLETTSFTPIPNNITSLASISSATEVFRDSSDGKIYYASNGTLHYISSPSKFQSLGISSTPITSVDNSIISLFVIGNPV